MSTYSLRQRLLDIARLDVGKTEDSKNRAPWIEKFWPATSYPEGYSQREPYCAAAQSYWHKLWLNDDEVLHALGLTEQKAEKWRCKSAAAFGWLQWARKTNNVKILPKECILHAGDLAVYSYSHIELVSDDDSTLGGPFMAIGANTNSAGSRDGEGCFEKPRSRSLVKNFIRILE